MQNTLTMNIAIRNFSKAKSSIIFGLIFFISIIFSQQTYGQSFSRLAVGNWDNNPTNLWATTGGGVATKTVPLTADDVTIQAGNTITLNAGQAYTCNSLVVTGSLVMGAGSSLTVTGGTGVTGAGTINMTAGGIINIGGTGGFTFTGTFTPGAGTINMNGAAQSIRAATYNNLIFAGSGVKTINVGTTTISGTLTGTAGVITTGSNLNINGGVVVTAATMNATANTVTYTNAAATNIFPGAYSSLTLAAGGTKTLTAATTVNGAFSLTSNLNCAGFDLTLVGGTSGAGTLTTGANTVTYSGAAQSVFATTYNNITFAGSNNKSLLGAVTVSGTATGTAGNILCATNNLTFNGTVSVAAATITTGLNVVTYNSASTQDIFSGTYSGNLDLAGAGAKTLRGATTVTGTYSMASALSCGANALTLNGTVTYTSGALTTGANTVTYGSASAQTVIPATYSGALTLNGGGTKSLSAATTVNGAFTLTSNLNCAGFDLTLVGATSGAGTLTTGANTVTYSALAAQNVFATTYNNLTFGGNNTKTLSGAVIVNGTSTVNTVTVACAANNLDLNGAVNWTAGTITTTTGNVTYNSASGQDIIPGTYSSNLTISGAGAKTLRGATTVTGTYSMASALSCGVNALTLNGTVTYTSGALTTGANTVTYGSAAAQTVIPATYSGAVTLSGAGAKTLSAATTVNGTFTLTSNLDCLGNNLILGGGTAGAGTLTTGANTVTYSAGVVQSIYGTTYNNLTLSGAAIKTLGAATVVNGALLVGTGATLQLSTFNFTANSTIDITGTLTDNSVTGTNLFVGNVKVNSGGNFSNTGNPAYTFQGGIQNDGTFALTGTGTVTFNTSSQSINGIGAMSFANATVLINGITITNSNTNTVTISASLNGTNASSIWVNANGSNLVYANATTMFVGGGSLDASANTNTVNYGLNGAQTVLATTYHNLTASAGGTKTLAGNTTVNNNLVVSAGNLDLGTVATTFSVSGNATLALACNLNFGTITTKTVTIVGDVSGAGAINTNTSLALHVLNLGGASNTIGAFTTSAVASVVNYNRVGNQTIFATANYRTLNVTGSGTKTIQGATTINNDITIPSGITLALNANTLTTAGNITINNGGILDVNANATLAVANTRVIANSGTLRVVGTLGNPATVTRNAAGNYSITQSAVGATIQANFFAFNFLGAGGIAISDGTIDVTNNFSNGTFASGVGAQYLNLTGLNFSDFSASNTVFNAGPTFNVTRTSGTGTVTFLDATGTLAGEVFDNDNANPGTLINWSNPVATYYSQGTNNFSLLTNWNKVPGGGGANPSAADLTNGLSTFIIQNTHTVTLDQNIDVLALTVGGGTSGALVIGDGTDRTLLSRQDLQVKAGASMTVANIDGTHTLDIRGNFTNAGTFNMRTSLTRFANTNFNGTNTQIFGPSTPVFFNVAFKTGSNTTANVALDIDGNVTLEAGSIFQDGGLTHTVAGDWNDGTTGAMTGTGTIQFNSNSQSVASASTFNNITFNGGGAAITIPGAITATGNFLVTNNTTVLASANVTHAIAQNFTVDAGSNFNHSNGTVDFNGTTAQSIDGSNATFFVVRFINGGVPNPKTILNNLVATNQLNITATAVVNSAGQIATANMVVDGTCGFTNQISFTGGGTISKTVAGAINLSSANIICTAGNTFIQVGSSVTSAGNFTINAGAQFIVDNNATLTGGAGNVFTANAGGNLYLRGINNFPFGYGTFNIAATSTTIYDAAFNQTVRGGLSIGNLNLSNNTKTLSGSLDINGNLNLSNSVVANFSAFSHTIAGNINNPVGSSMTSTSTITLDNPDGDQTIGAGGTYNLGTLNFTSTAPTAVRNKYINTNITLAGSFSAINSGGTSALINNVFLYGNVITGPGAAFGFTLGSNVRLLTSGTNTFQTTVASFGTKTLDVASIVRFNNTTNATDQSIPFGFSYGTIELQGAGAAGETNTKTALGALDINGSFINIANAFTFIDGGFAHTIAGDWSVFAGAYPAPTSTITFDGTTAQLIGPANQNLNFNNIVFSGFGSSKTFANTNNGSTVTILGNLTINTGVTVDINSKNVNIAGNWTSTGVFSQAATTTFSGTTADQTVSMGASSNFGGFNINKTNASFNTVTASTDLQIAGSLTLTANNANFAAGVRTISIGNDFNFNTGTTFTTTGTFLFNGSNLSQVLNMNTTGATFQNLSFSGTQIKTLATNDITVNGNLTIIGSATFNGNNRQITVLGNWVNGGTFQHNSTVNFTGSFQNISASNFSSVNIAGTNIKTLSGNINLNGSLTIAAASTLDVSASNYAVSLDGSWTNNGTFTPRLGTVTFGGNGKNITTGGIGAGKRFYNVTLSMTAATDATLVGAIDIDNDLIITSGRMVTGANNVNVGGTMMVTEAFNQNNNASVLTFDAGVAGIKTFNPGNSVNSAYRAITVNGNSGLIVQLTTNNLTIGNTQNLTVTSGAFKLNGKTLTMSNGNIVVTTNGTFDVDAGANLYLADNASITNTGTLKILGTSTNYANILRNGGTGAQGYTITQTAGTFSAQYYSISNTKGAGVTISGGTIDATNNFSNGTFSGSGTSYLTLNGLNYTGTASSVVFNAGPTFNVNRTSGPGIITFNAATGDLAGPLYENDLPDGGAATGFCQWTAFGKRWGNFTADNNWNTPGNWSPSGVPTSSDTIYLDHNIIAPATAYTVNITSADAAAYRLIVDKQGGAGVISLVLSGGRSLTVGENINILTGNILTATNNTNILNIGGNWSNSGTFNNGSSTVNFNGGAGSYTLSPGGSSFFNLNINNGGTYTLSSAITMAGSLNVSNGTLNAGAGGNTVNVAGNWNNIGGTFIPQTGLVNLNGASAQSVAGGPFYDLATASAGVKNITSSLTITRNITIGATSSINAGTNILFVGGNWANNSGTGAFTQTSFGTVYFNGGANQTIDNGTSGTTFNNVTLSGVTNHTKFLGRNIVVNGNLDISSSAVITLDAAAFTITGLPANTFTINGTSAIILRGVNNFPSGFGTNTLAAGSTVNYILNSNQTIFAAAYGNLTLTSGAVVNNTKTATGAIVVQGNLTLSDVSVQLDMNNADMTLAGNLAFPTAGRQILWGTGMFTHNGAGWNIDVDYTGFSPDFGNVTLTGSGTKTMLANLNIGGNFSVQSGVAFTMNTFLLTSTGASKTFTLANGATLNCNVVAPEVAFPKNFTTNATNANSTVILNGASNQLVFANTTYGNLYLSNNAVNNTLTGVLNVAGDFYNRAATLVDASFNMNLSGAINDIRNYTPSVGTVITLNGSTQSIYDGVNGANLDLGNVVFSNAGTKTLGSTGGVGNIVNISGNVTIASGVTVNTNRNVNFSGSTWTNNGSFNHSANTFTFNGTIAQAINPGLVNSYQQVVFANTTAPVTFNTRGGNFANTGASGFIINVGAIVDMGTALTHNISGTVTNNGTWTTNNANFNFNGGNQTITTPVFAAQNVFTSTNGTKTMGCNWSVNDLTIGINTTLSATATPYDLTVTGNWTNSGGFNNGGNTVTFESNNTSAKTITAGGSNFNNVNFNQSLTAARTYTLLSPATTFANNLLIGSGATLNLNSNTLTLGSNNASTEAHLIAAGATLQVNANANLRFNNQNGNSSLTVNGTLITVGTSGNIATITRATANGRTDIVINGTIKANFYLYDFIGDAGMVINSSATVDATDNLSNGTWSNMNTAGGAAKYYLVLEAPVSTNIANVTFNFGGTPTTGVHYNVRRSLTATGVVTFVEAISGILGSFLYEDDPTGPTSPSATTGKCLWPTTVLATWTGAINRDWNVAGNWSPATVPTNAIDALIPNVANDPIITSANAVCRNITLSDGILGLDNGFDLVVNKDVVLGTAANAAQIQVLNSGCDITVLGAWTKNANATFSHGNGRVTFTGAAGAYTINPGLSAFFNLDFNGSTSNFNLNGATVNVDGSMNIINGTVFPLTAAYNINIKGNFTNSDRFSPATPGTITLSGLANQSVTNVSIRNLVVSGTGIKTFFATDTINGTIVVNSGATLAANNLSTLYMLGNVTINTGGSFDDGSAIHYFRGATWTGTGNWVTNTGTIVFDGTGQNIGSSKFNNLILTGSGNKTLNGNVTLNADFTLKTGTGTFVTNTFLLSSATGASNFSMEAGTNMNISGANNCPSNFSTYTVDPVSNTNYNAAFDQTVGGITYGNLNLSNITTKTLAGDIVVVGNLNINTSTLDVSASNYTITVSGNFDNNSTGSFTARNGTVIMTGAANNVIYLGAGGGVKDFYDLVIDKTNASTNTAINRNLNILNDLTVLTGAYNTNGFTTTVSNNMIATAGTFTNNGGGGYIFNKPSGAANIQTNGSTLRNLTFSGGATYTTLDNLTINGAFTQTAGTFNGNGKTVSLGDFSDVVSIAGTYIVGTGGKLVLGNNCSVTVTSTGTIEIVGTPVSIAQVTRNPTFGGTYNFTVDGIIKAQYYQFEYMSNSGIQINASATIDVTDNFSNGTFTNGPTTGTMFRIENTQTLTIDNVSFPINPGAGVNNVTKITATSGIVTFNLATGVFAGEGFENDGFIPNPPGLIQWTGPIVLTWNGSVSSDWFTAANWTASTGPNIVPTGAEDVVMTNSGNLPVLNADGARARKLTVNGVFTLNTPASPLADLTVLGDMYINTGTLISTSVNDTIIVAGNWNKLVTGTFNPGSSTVILNSTTGTRTVNNGTSTFNNLVIDGTSLFQLAASTTILGNLSILQGTLDVTSSGFSMTVRGNWLNQGTFVSGNGFVNFNSNAAGTRTINSGGSAFNSLFFSPSAATTYQLIGNNVATKSNITIGTQATLALNGLSCLVGDNVGSDNITINGTVNVNANASLKMSNNGSVTVNSGGTLTVVGTDAINVASMSRQSAGNYSVIVNSGGNIQAQYYVIEYLGVGGMVINSGATIHPINNFSRGTFSNGVLGGTYLDVRNTFADFVMDSVIFNTGATFNCTRLSGAGVITFHDATGGLGGYYYEKDEESPANSPTTGLVQWTYTFPITTWSGAVSSDWNNVGNWDNGVPSNSFSAIVPDVSGGSNRYPVLTSGADGSARDLTVFSPATFTLGSAKNLTVLGGLIVNSGAAFTVSPASASTITVGDQWTTNGTFTNGGASSVVLNAPLGVKSITAGANSFYNLTIAAGATATLQTNSSITVLNNMNITSGAFKIANSAHLVKVAGNWTKSPSAIFTATLGTVQLNKTSGVQTISGTGNTFYDLDIRGGSTQIVNLANDINIDRKLYIASGCTFSAGSSNVNIKGDWNNAGKQFVPGTGTVSFTGSSNQSISKSGGELFNNITINSTSSVTCASAVTVNKVVTLTSGTFASAGNLTLNLTTGGAIAPTGSGSLSGIMKTARTFVETVAGWHYIGTPLQGTTSNDVHTAIPLTNNNWYFYKEQKGGMYIQLGWTRILPLSSLAAERATNMSAQRAVGGPTNMVGYGLKFPVGTTNLTLTGTYNHAVTSYSSGALSYTAYGQTWGDGWQLLSNPYPSHIDWNLVTKTNIDPTITYYNRALGTNATYLKGTFPFPDVSSNGGTQYIPPMQAYWVQTLTGGGSVTVPNSSRVVNPLGTPPTFYRNGVSNTKTLKLSVTNTKCSDEAIVRFGKGATEKYDVTYDAYKFSNDNACPNIYFVVDTAQLVINSLPEIVADKAIPMSFESVVAGENTITIKDLDNFGDMKEIVLLDKQTNQSQNLLQNDTYKFTASKGDATDRFVLNFVPAEEVLALNDRDDLSKYVNINSYQNKVIVDFSKRIGDNADIIIANTLGQEVYNSENTNIRSGRVELNVGKVPSAVYVVKVVVKGKSYAKEVLLSK